MPQQRILLAHLNSNGDCLYSTVIARQIKEVDYPGCHLTWVVNSNCKKTVMLNPHVDEIWEYPTQSLLATEKEWAALVTLAEQRKKQGEFNHVFYLQIIGKNIVNIDGGIRSSIYRCYPHPVTVPMTPVIRLSAAEVNVVKSFTEKHQLSKYKNVILVECGPDSFKSSLNPSSSAAFAKQLVQKFNDTAVILSSSKKIQTDAPNIIDGSSIGFRENAELTKYCTLFIGCSSGISWLTTTDWAKPLPRIILTTRSSNFSYSMVFDHEYAGLPTDNIIEFPEHENIMQELGACVDEFLTAGLPAARKKFHKPLKVKSYKFIYILSRMSFARWNFTAPFKALARSFRENGFDKMTLLYLLKAYIKLPGYVFSNLLKKWKSSPK